MLTSHLSPMQVAVTAGPLDPGQVPHEQAVSVQPETQASPSAGGVGPQTGSGPPTHGPGTTLQWPLVQVATVSAQHCTG